MPDLWLPFTQDTRQQGLSNASVTAVGSGATINANGKLGKCYYLDGTSNGYITTDFPTNFGTNNFTISLWVKIPTISSGSYYTIVSSKQSAAISAGVGIYWNYSQKKFLWSTADGTNTTEIWMADAVDTIVYDKWIHLVMVRDNNDAKHGCFYINGTRYELASVPPIRNITTATNLWVGKLSDGHYPCKLYISDIRVWNDHALSPKEVEVLSRGLVCHYPLCDSAVEPTTNLVTSISAGGQTTINGDMVTTSGENKDTYFTLNLSESITVGTQYTISCDVSGVPSDQHWIFPLGSQTNRSLIWELKNGHNEYTFTANNIDWGTKRIFMDDTSRTFYGVTTFSHFQLEKKDHATLYAGLGGTRSGDTTVYDCSGYQYNGTANKAMTVSDNTARYSKCTIFDGNTDSIQIPFCEMLGLTSAAKTDYTVSVWTYKSVIGTKNYQTILGGPGGFELEARDISATDPKYRLHNWGGGTAAYEFNKWTYFCFVHSLSDCKLYVNGELKVTGSSVNVPIGNFFIGAWSNTSSQNFEGKMSDFRIYATALSAAQVAELYNTAVSVANNGSLLGYELVEG